MDGFWPRTLFGRNVLVLAAATALSVLLSIASMYVLILEAQIDRSTGIAAELINTLSAAALELEPRALDVLMSELDDSEFLQIKPLGITPHIGDYRETPIDKMIMRRIIDRLDYQGAMDWRIGENRTLWLNLRIGENFYWVAAESRTSWTPIRLLMLIIFIIVLVVTAIGALATRHISKPLAALELETDRLSLSSDWKLETIGGPAEIAALARSFKRMTTRLKEAESIRAGTLAELSHDLRTPLARLRLAVEMMQGDKELKQSASRQVEQIDRLIDQFIDYARDEETEPRHAFSLTDLALEVAGAFSIEADVASQITLCGRKESIRRAMINMVENAQKYGAKPVGLHLSNPGTHALIEVTDAGSGFNAERALELVKPFIRGESETRVAGSGLGLTIVQRVAIAHQGRIAFHQLQPTGFVVQLSLKMTKDQ